VTTDAISPLRWRMIEDKSAIALSATAQRHPFSQLTTKQRDGARQIMLCQRLVIAAAMPNLIPSPDAHTSLRG